MIPSLSMSQRQFALLTDQGVYIIVQRRPIDYLYALLVSSCDERSCSSSKMLDIKRRIFEYYGLSQSCAMCIGIACDLPYDITSTISGDFNAHYSSSLQVNDTVKRNAIIVMKQISQSTNPARGEPQILDDGKIVWSTTFHALYQVFSRIVRPIWYRNLIGPDPKNRSKSLPILTTSEFQALLEPLKKLAQIIKIHHRDAIEYTSGDRTGSVDNKMSEARVEENKLLNDFYRLVSRTIQAIRVIQIILEAQSVQKLSVKWSDLCNATFMKFVTNSSSHSRIKHGLQRMVCVKNPPPVLTHIMHKLARECFFFFSIGSVHKYHGVNELRKAEDAPQFSQKRDQHTAIAINELCKPGIEWDSILYDKDKTDQSLRTICNNFLKLGELGQQGVVNVCMSAAKEFMGNYLDKGMGIFGNSRLNISVVTSNDFNDTLGWERGLYRGESTRKSPENSMIERRDKDIIRRLRRIIFDTNSKIKWSDLREDLQNMLEGADIEEILSAYESNVIARGSYVEKVDTYLESCTDMKLFEWVGKMDCYAVLFSKIKQVQEAEYIPVGIGAVLHDTLISTSTSCKTMIRRAVDCTKDHDFHHLLYKLLVQNNMSNFLLDLRTMHVENFLREEDPLRLYHYFYEQQRYQDAMDLMMRLACTDDEEDILNRVEYLNNAIDSAEKSRKGMITGGSSGKQFRTTSEAIVSLREKLKMAIFQQNLANQINYLRNFTIPKNPEDSNIALFGDLWKKVNYSIMEYSDMFNEITQPFGLWEESLQILNICNYQDEELVKRLWLSIMVGAIPQTSSDPDLQRFIDTWLNQIVTHDIFFNARRDKSSLVTENWEDYFPELCTQVSSLGKELGINDDGGSLAFPTALILENLEKLVIQLIMHNHSTGFQTTDRDIVLNAFLDTGMHHKALLDAYIGLMNRSKHSADITLDNLQLCWSSATLLLQWVEIYQGHDNSTEAKVARMNFRSFFHSRMHTLMNENSMITRILNEEASISADHAMHTLMQSTKARLNEVKQLVQNLSDSM